MMNENNLELGSDDVHLWRIELDQAPKELQRCRQVLNTAERERVDRLKKEKARARATVARAHMRIILAGYLKTSADAITFSKGQYGKPYIATAKHFFNLSHSKNIALLGVSRQENLGVDIEFWRPVSNLEGIVQRHYSRSEKAQWARLKESEKEKVFFDNWSRKEAFIKATGRGLGMGLSSISFDLTGSDGLIGCAEQYGDPLQWQTQQLELAEQVSAVLIRQLGSNGPQAGSTVLRDFNNL